MLSTAVGKGIPGSGFEVLIGPTGPFSKDEVGPSLELEVIDVLCDLVRRRCRKAIYITLVALVRNVEQAKEYSTAKTNYDMIHMFILGVGVHSNQGPANLDSGFNNHRSISCVFSFLFQRRHDDLRDTEYPLAAHGRFFCEKRFGSEA